MTGTGQPGSFVRSWRPRRLMITAGIFTGLFVGGSVIGWFALPPDIRAMFTAFQVITLLSILAVMVGVMWLLAGSSVRADDDGLTIRNGWHRRHLAWDQIRRVRLRPGDPWATAELVTDDAEGEAQRVPMLGLQGSEGTDAREAVREINAHLAAF